MDSPDPKGAVEHLISVLRKATRIVQLTPFVFLCLMSIYLLTEPLLPFYATRLADIVFDVPLAGMAGMLMMGRLFRLCAWFRTAVLLPLASKVASWVDAYVLTFTQSEIVTLNIMTGVLLIIFLIASYRHFFAHGK